MAYPGKSNINWIDVGDVSPEDEGEDPSNFCYFCRVRLAYLTYEDIMYCPNCGWRQKKEYLAAPTAADADATQPQQQTPPPPPPSPQGAVPQDQQFPVMRGGKNDHSNYDIGSSSTTIEDQSVFSAFPLTRNKEVRKRLDPDYSDNESFHQTLSKKGYRLIWEETKNPV